MRGFGFSQHERVLFTGGPLGYCGAMATTAELRASEEYERRKAAGETDSAILADLRDLSKLSYDELYARASSQKIKGRGSMSKDELIDVLS